MTVCLTPGRTANANGHPNKGKYQMLKYCEIHVQFFERFNFLLKKDLTF